MTENHLCDRAFNADDIVMLKEALRIACEKLQFDGSANVELNNRLAKFIIDAARVGFSQPQTLARLALDRLIISSLAGGYGRETLVEVAS